MKRTLDDYGKLLGEVDLWFASCLAKNRERMACSSGCSECCRSLFDITLLDAAYLKRGFDRLDGPVKARVLQEARERLAAIQAIWPDFAEPYILNYRPEEEWELLMPDDDETPCPLLGDDGRCLVYEYRPMTCRLHGIPLVDISGEVMHDEWCTLNFNMENPLDIEELRWEFISLFRRELLLFRELTYELFERKINELDAFIPTAILIDFDKFPWRKWWEKHPHLFLD